MSIAKKHPVIFFFFLTYLVSAAATSVVTTWVFNHTSGSVLVATFHSAADASIVITGVITGGSTLFWLFIAVQWLAGLLVTLVQGPATLACGLKPAVLPANIEA